MTLGLTYYPSKRLSLEDSTPLLRLHICHKFVFPCHPTCQLLMGRPHSHPSKPPSMVLCRNISSIQATASDRAVPVARGASSHLPQPLPRTRSTCHMSAGPNTGLRCQRLSSTVLQFCVHPKGCLPHALTFLCWFSTRVGLPRATTRITR